MKSVAWPRSASPRWWPAVLAVLLSACAAQTPATQPPAWSHHAPQARKTAVPELGLALVIQKSRRTLTVYRDGTATGEFPVVIGRNGNRGPKRFEGDLRTPEGLYRVTEKHPHARWRYFIGISYPNDYDVAAYATAISDGGVPVVDGEFMGIGGAVGIHGSDRHSEQAAGLDWTLGCVALRSEDVGVIYELVEPGTPVLILP